METREQEGVKEETEESQEPKRLRDKGPYEGPEG